MKLCTLCKMVEVKNGQSWCDQCRKNYLKQYRKNNAKHIKKLMTNWRNNNREYYKNSKYEYYSSLSGRLVELNSRAKKRAKKKHIKYDLPTDFLEKMWHQQHGLCALTKLEMQIPTNRNGKALPFSPSIDRIDSNRGYTKDNVRIVCYAINCSLHDYGEKIFEIIARAYIYQELNVKYLDEKDQIPLKTAKQIKDKKYFESQKGIITTLYGSCHNSKQKVKINKQNIAELFILQNNKCAITNIKFDYKFIGDKKSNPFRPSIDRINSNKGYIADNIRLVCVAVNYALNEFGEEIFRQICKAYLSSSKK